MDGESKKSAFILGYSGETGSELLKEVIRKDLFSKVVLIGRRTLSFNDETLDKLEQKIINFEEEESLMNSIKNFQVGFCCLGTTRAEAGAEGFFRVDHDYVLNSAKAAKLNGCEEFHLLTSQGANENSSILYNKTKGQVEKDVKDLNFKKLFVYRPGVLLCDRKKSRPLERSVKFLLKPVSYLFPSFITVPTKTLAKAICVVAADSAKYSTYELFDNKTIHSLAAEK